MLANKPVLANWTCAFQNIFLCSSFVKTGLLEVQTIINPNILFKSPKKVLSIKPICDSREQYVEPKKVLSIKLTCDSRE